MEQQVYKVLSVLPDKSLNSAMGVVFHSSDEKDMFISKAYNTTYTVGVKSYPTIQYSYLYAFNSYYDAKRFFNAYKQSFGRRDIYLCNASVVTNIRPKVSCSMTMILLEDFWRRIHNNEIINFNDVMTAVPQGTVLCHWIQPIKRVYYQIMTKDWRRIYAEASIDTKNS